MNETENDPRDNSQSHSRFCFIHFQTLSIKIKINKTKKNNEERNKREKKTSTKRKTEKLLVPAGRQQNPYTVASSTLSPRVA
jgi:hypothetical protein